MKKEMNKIAATDTISNNFNFDDLYLSADSPGIRNHQSYRKAKAIYLREIGNAGNVNLSNTSREVLGTIKEGFYKNKVNGILYSRYLSSTNAIYQKIIKYYSGFSLYRTHGALSTLLGATNKKQKPLREAYDQLLNYIDSLNIPTLYPEMIENLLIDGSLYITTKKQGKGISAFSLPNEYCRMFAATDKTTKIIKFNFAYFDQFVRKEGGEAIFDLFSKEFQTSYNEYLKDGEKWRQLDYRKSTGFKLNHSELPIFLDTILAIKDYNLHNQTDVEKAQAELQKILIQRIPTNTEGKLIIDAKQMKALQASMKKVVQGNKGFQAVTVVGETQIEDVFKKTATEINQLQNSFNNIFNSIGVNNNIFNSNTVKGLLSSIATDRGFINGIIEKFNVFFNIAINTYYNLSPYQGELTVLNIDVHNETEQIKQYTEHAKFGVGITQAIIATGIKQSTITNQLKIEEELELHSRLIPLQSTHTTNGVEETTKTNVKKEEEELDEG